MNVTSIISVCIAFLSLVFSTIWNANNAKKSQDKEYQELLKTIKSESAEKREMQVLFKEMNKNLERIVEDNRIMNDRIYHLSERVTLLEHDKKNYDNAFSQISVLDNKANKAHQRIDVLEHDFNNGKKGA